MTQLSPETFRQFGPDFGPERQIVDDLLDFHRGTLLWKCSGLDGQQLTTKSAGASDLTLLGIIRHLTEVERFWFRQVATQQAGGGLYSSDDAPEADFTGGSPESAERDLQALRDEMAASRAAVADLSLDLEFPSNDQGPMSLRWVYLHMIAEYARHNGHVDLLRENIDGLVGE